MSSILAFIEVGGSQGTKGECKSQGLAEEFVGDMGDRPTPLIFGWGAFDHRINWLDSVDECNSPRKSTTRFGARNEGSYDIRLCYIKPNDLWFPLFLGVPT